MAFELLDRRLVANNAVFPGLWFYGTVGSVRRWSEIATVQPYWLGLTQSVTDENPDPTDKFNIHTTGVRAYGIVNETPGTGTWPTSSASGRMTRHRTPGHIRPVLFRNGRA